MASNNTDPNVVKIIKDNWLTMTNREIGELIGISATAVRSRGKRMGLPSKTQTFRSGDKTTMNKQYISFLSKAKTEQEILKRFGDLKVLETTLETHELIRQRDAYNRILYILLPKISENVVLKKKIIFYHTGKSEDGTEQPYVLCQLPNFKGRLKIALLFDVHYGHAAHRYDKFIKYIQWIKNNKNVYAILGGDLMENALDDGRGMSYDQRTNPHTQFDDMYKILAPIAHKILVAIPGNHENRTYKKTGIDIMRLLAQKLEIPYFSGPVWCSVLANGYKWNLFIKHGEGNSQTKGGKMNNANRPKKFTGLIHFFISGHVHDRVCESETIITDDPINCRLLYLEQWTIIAPSFLHWENTYAYRAGYPPPASGGVAIELLDNGAYRGALT